MFLSLIPGGAGFVLLVYGKKEQRWPYIVAGLAYMIYPYFTPNVHVAAGRRVLIAGVPLVSRREGW